MLRSQNVILMSKNIILDQNTWFWKPKTWFCAQRHKNNNKSKIGRKVDVKRPKWRPPELSISVYDQNFVRSQILTTRTSEHYFFYEFLMKNGSENLDEKIIGPVRAIHFPPFWVITCTQRCPSLTRICQDGEQTCPIVFWMREPLKPLSNISFCNFSNPKIIKT